MPLSRRLFLAALTLSCPSLVVADDPAEPSPADASPAKALLRKSFLGEKPPEIVGEAAHWLGPPPFTKLEQLHGHVVWLQFNF